MVKTILLLNILALSFNLGEQVLHPNVKEAEGRWEIENYKYHTYDEMRSKLNKLEKMYPRLMKIETAAEKLKIPHFVYCGDKE